MIMHHNGCAHVNTYVGFDISIVCIMKGVLYGYVMLCLCVLEKEGVRPCRALSTIMDCGIRASVNARPPTSQSIAASKVRTPTSYTLPSADHWQELLLGKSYTMGSYKGHQGRIKRYLVAFIVAMKCVDPARWADMSKVEVRW